VLPRDWGTQSGDRVIAQQREELKRWGGEGLLLVRVDTHACLARAGGRSRVEASPAWISLGKRSRRVVWDVNSVGTWRCTSSASRGDLGRTTKLGRGEEMKLGVR